MDIKDGKGRGYVAEVNSDQQLEVASTQEARALWVNHVKGDAYVMYFSQAAANGAANECLAYIKNDDDKDLVIDKVSLHVTAADTVYLAKVTGTAGGTPTSIVPTNLNIGSGKTASGTFYKDDAMSGLTDAGKLLSTYLAALGVKEFEPKASIILKKNSAVAIFLTTQAVNTMTGTIEFHYETAHAGS